MKTKAEQNTQELWDNYKRCHTYILGIPDGEERKDIFEVTMAKNF